MGADLTLRTGVAGDYDQIVVDWIDEAGAHHHFDLEIVMLDRDRPRTIEVRIDKVTVMRKVGVMTYYLPED